MNILKALPLALVLPVCADDLNLVAYVDTYPADPYYRVVPYEEVKGYRYVCAGKDSIENLMDCFSNIKDKEIVDPFGTALPATINQCYGETAKTATAELVNSYFDIKDLPKREYADLPESFKAKIWLHVPFWELELPVNTQQVNAKKGKEFYCGVSIVKQDGTLSGFDWTYPDAYRAGEHTIKQDKLKLGVAHE